jgi:hypothetical protein
MMPNESFCAGFELHALIEFDLDASCGHHVLSHLVIDLDQNQRSVAEGVFISGPLKLSDTVAHV